MTDTNWTPGPWRTDTKAGFPYDIHCANGDMIANVEASSEGESNAELIAAAPELYEALSIAVKDGPAGYVEWLEFANEALAKARGEVE